MTIHLATCNVSRVSVASISTYLKQKETTTHKINLLDSPGNNETQGQGRRGEIAFPIDSTVEPTSFPSQVQFPALPLVRNFPPSLSRSAKETDGNGKHATWRRRGRRLRAINVSAAIDGRRDIDLRYLAARGSRQDKSRSNHEATINRALPPAI
jgi:hypothetical protein